MPFDYKTVSHVALLDRAEFQWTGSNSAVTVHFLGANGSAVAVTMPREVLSRLAADIADELARKPLSIPDR